MSATRDHDPEKPLHGGQRWRVEAKINEDFTNGWYRLVPIGEYGRQPVTGDILVAEPPPRGEHQRNP